MVVSFKDRLISYLIDLIVIVCLSSIVFEFMYLILSDGSVISFGNAVGTVKVSFLDEFYAVVHIFAIYFIYNILLYNIRSGQTLGNKLMQIKLDVDLNRKPLRILLKVLIDTLTLGLSSLLFYNGLNPYEKKIGVKLIYKKNGGFKND